MLNNSERGLASRRHGAATHLIPFRKHYILILKNNNKNTKLIDRNYIERK